MADLLLVDDTADVRDVLSDFLAMDGHHVRAAVDAYDGLRLLTERLPDVALLDVEMPEVTGPQMAYRMLVENTGRERVPIIFLSGIADLDRIARSVGTTYYLPKPFSLNALRQVLDKALREHAAPTYPDRDAIENARRDESTIK
jgi:CheY-like chemotaxis protein